MKADERRQARALRQQGWSLGEVARRLRCAKSSISRWVRDIPLTPEQLNQLESNQARGRAQAANHPNGPRLRWQRLRTEVSEIAADEVDRTCHEDILKLVGSALYWGEGAKRSTNVVNFSNSDPAMIQVMMRFFREICRVPEEKFRGALHIHPHLDAERARAFWSAISGIPILQFHRTQYGVSRASQGKRDTLPLGTFCIVIADARLLARILGWINGMKLWTADGANSSAVEHSAYIRAATGSNPVSPMSADVSALSSRRQVDDLSTTAIQ